MYDLIAPPDISVGAPGFPVESGWCDKAYDDDEAIILKIRDAKGDPPKEASDESKLTPEERKQLDEEDKKANAKPSNEEPEEEPEK